MRGSAIFPCGLQIQLPNSTLRSVAVFAQGTLARCQMAWLWKTVKCHAILSDLTGGWLPSTVHCGGMYSGIRDLAHV